MDAYVSDCLVKGYRSLIPRLRLRDLNERHVLAAAVRAKVDVIVIFNLKHFPAEQLSPYGIVAQHPVLCKSKDLAPKFLSNFPPK